jgi:hypothetical protein
MTESANIREMRFLIFCDMKCEWARKAYTVCCTRDERSSLAWFKTSIWKLREMRKESEKGRCSLCRGEEEGALHILLKCSEKRKWREQFLSRKWLIVNEEATYKRITNCTNAVELRNIRK